MYLYYPTSYLETMRNYIIRQTGDGLGCSSKSSGRRQDNLQS